MKSINRLGVEVFTYGFASIASRMINYVLVPIHTYVLSPQDFGIVTELYSYIAIMQVIYGLGVETAYYRFSKDIQNFRDVALSTTICISVILSGTITLFAQKISKFINLPGSERYITLCAAILVIDSWLGIPFAELRQSGRGKAFSLVRFLQILINLILNIFLVYIPIGIDLGVELDRISCILFANALANGVFVPICMKMTGGFRLDFDFEVIRKVFNFSLPAVFINVVTAINDSLSRLSIKYWLPQNLCEGDSVEYVLGIFSACQKIAVVMVIATQAFRYAVEPMLYTKKTSSRAWYGLLMYWFIVFGCIIITVACLNLEIISRIFIRKNVYLNGLELVPLMFLTSLLSGIYYNLSIWYKLCNKIWYGVRIAVCGCITTFLVSYVMIPKLGYWGAVYGSIAGYCIMIIICYTYGRKYYAIPYDLPIYVVFIMFTMLLVYGAKFIYYGDNTTFVLAIKAISSVIFSGIIFSVAKKLDKFEIKEERQFD